MAAPRTTYHERSVILLVRRNERRLAALRYPAIVPESGCGPEGRGFESHRSPQLPMPTTGNWLSASGRKAHPGSRAGVPKVIMGRENISLG